MTSKEALKSICLECEREKGKNKTACPFRSISNDYCEEYEKIEKDLEVLEILKKHIEINMYGTDAGDKKTVDILIFEDDKDFKTIKEIQYGMEKHQH